MRNLFGIGLIGLMLLGCAPRTEFYGEPKVPNGADGCRQICTQLGMQLAGMVVIGEYSDGCICAVPGQAPGQQVYVGATGAVAAAAGVRVQMDADEEEEEAARRRDAGN